METPRRILRNKHLDNISQITTPLKLPPSPLLKTLGFGTGVKVFQLDRSPFQGNSRSPWAVKRISKVAKNQGQILYEDRLKVEAEILRKLSHPNVVGFRAFHKAQDGLDSLAIECCQTSLGDILEDRLENSLGPLPSHLTLKMSWDTSKALDYLHNTAKLLHADIKSYNILIKDQNNFEICKLCDFGVSIPLDENSEINLTKTPNLKYIGTEIWSAPEVIEEEDIISDKADIFSFGLVIYETIALIPPHTWNIGGDEDEENYESFQENNECAFGTRPPLPEAFELTDDYNKVVELFYACTNELPENRPPAKHLVAILSDIISKKST